MELICTCGHLEGKHGPHGGYETACLVRNDGYVRNFTDVCLNFQADNLEYLKKKFEDLKNDLV